MTPVETQDCSEVKTTNPEEEMRLDSHTDFLRALLHLRRRTVRVHRKSKGKERAQQKHTIYDTI